MLIIPLILTLIGINLYFRYVILGKFRKLSKKDVELNLSQFINRKKRTSYIERHYPDQAEELLSLGRSLDMLMFGVLTIIAIMAALFILQYLFS